MVTSRRKGRALVALVFFLFLFVVQAFQHSGFTRTALRRFSQTPRDDDSSVYAETLPLSEDDKARLFQMRSRQLTVPIVFLDAMVPLQQLTCRSSDPKLKTLIETCFRQQIHEVGMFGLNPLTRQPLCHGVSFMVNNSTVQFLENDGTLQLQVIAQQRRLEIQGEPWLDDTESFYMALVEVQSDDDSSEEVLTPKQQAQAQQLSDKLPALVNEWKQAVLTAKATDQEGLQLRCKPLGPMPESSLTDRAFWVAALINPLPPLGVCLEIRPSMLAAENDYDRILLACQAIQGSIDHLTGKQRLF